VKQPVGAAIYSNFDCLSFYDGGVVTDHACRCSDPEENDVNHAITIVGYGTHSGHGCKDYWLIRNSWGSSWGDDGFFKLCAERSGRTKEFGTCQINSYIMWPTL
jgi:C1A family cysteine protease